VPGDGLVHAALRAYSTRRPDGSDGASRRGWTIASAPGRAWTAASGASRARPDAIGSATRAVKVHAAGADEVCMTNDDRAADDRRPPSRRRMSRMRPWISVAMLVAVYPLLVGYGGPNPFHVARLLPSGDNFQPGNWVESTTVASKDEITVVIMASWCPHCVRMIDQLAADPDARRRVDMVLLFDDENGAAARQGEYVKYPAKLAGRDLPYFFAKDEEFAGLYRGFPTILACTRQGCTTKSRADIGLR